MLKCVKALTIFVWPSLWEEKYVGGKGMLNEAMDRMKNADEFLIISNCNPRKAEKIFLEFTSGHPLLEGMTVSYLLQLGLN